MRAKLFAVDEDGQCDSSPIAVAEDDDALLAMGFVTLTGISNDPTFMDLVTKGKGASLLNGLTPNAIGAAMISDCQTGGVAIYIDSTEVWREGWSAA